MSFANSVKKALESFMGGSNNSNNNSNSNRSNSSSNTVKYKYGGYSEKPTNDGKIYGTTNDGRDWQTGEQVVDYSYRGGNSNKDNSSIFREDRVTGSGGYNWVDPNKSEYVLVDDGRGGQTSVSRKEAIEEGYNVIGASGGITKWHTDEAIRNNTSGSDFVSDGYNSGTVSFRDGNDKLISVNSAYADKYFDKGYTLDSKSQSINRALQSDYFKSYNNANSAIREDRYNSNDNYNIGSHIPGKGYKFDDGGFVDYSPGINFNQPELYSPQIIPPKTNSPQNKTSSGGTQILNIDGAEYKVSDEEWLEIMFKQIGI